MKNVLVIGMGNMGKAIFGMIKKRRGISVAGVDHGNNLNSALKKADVFFIAVKPQDFETLGKSIKIDLSRKIAVSIMAGVSIGKIMKTLRVKRVVRVMPNLPLKVGMSLSGWKAGKNLSAGEKKFVRDLLKMFGEEIEVQNEDKLDQITALSGSGPAYFYYLAEIIGRKAKELGFSSAESEKIGNNVLVGSALLLKKSGMSAAELRAKVTSKKGTTEAALKTMQKLKLDKTVKRGIEAAYKRAIELNK